MYYPWDDKIIVIRRNMRLRRRRLDMFGFKRSDRILDLGCGDGLDTQVLREQGYNDIIGADISPNLLKLAKKCNPGVRFVRASADNLPFANGSFDAVLANSMIYHVVGNAKAIREIRRVLVNNGRLCIIDMHASWARIFLNFLTFSPFRHLVPYLGRRRTAYLSEQEAIERWHHREADFLRMLTREGFRKEYIKNDLLSFIGEYRKKS